MPARIMSSTASMGCIPCRAILGFTLLVGGARVSPRDAGFAGGAGRRVRARQACLCWSACGAAVLLAYEHSLVRHDDLSKLNAAFFTMNGVISVVFFVFVAGDLLLRRN